jgi:hypothetical protein
MAQLRSQPSPPRSPAPHPNGTTATAALLRTNEGLRHFIEAVTAPDARERDGDWLGGIREYIPDAGPEPSSRFF